jgi:hypothetical protein
MLREAPVSTEELIEVLQFLSKESAQVLMLTEPGAQRYALGVVYVLKKYWEEQGLDLDPIQMQGVCDSIALYGCVMYTEMQRHVDSGNSHSKVEQFLQDLERKENAQKSNDSFWQKLKHHLFD